MIINKSKIFRTVCKKDLNLPPTVSRPDAISIFYNSVIRYSWIDYDDGWGNKSTSYFLIDSPDNFSQLFRDMHGTGLILMESKFTDHFYTVEEMRSTKLNLILDNY